MKKKDVPQDESALRNISKEMVYAIDDTGKYTSALSIGWEIKAKALEVAWQEIDERIAVAKQKIKNNEASPLLYYIELRLMDLDIVSAYTGFWKFTIKQHLKPAVFNKLSDKKLQKYADAFNVSIAEIKNRSIYE